MRVCLYLPDGRRMVGEVKPQEGKVLGMPCDMLPWAGIVWGEINLEFFCLNGMGVYVYKHCNDVLTPTLHLSDDEFATFVEYGNG